MTRSHASRSRSVRQRWGAGSARHTSPCGLYAVPPRRSTAEAWTASAAVRTFGRAELAARRRPMSADRSASCRHDASTKPPRVSRRRRYQPLKKPCASGHQSWPRRRWPWQQHMCGHITVAEIPRRADDRQASPAQRSPASITAGLMTLPHFGHGDERLRPASCLTGARFYVIRQCAVASARTATGRSSRSTSGDRFLPRRDAELVVRGTPGAEWTTGPTELPGLAGAPGALSATSTSCAIEAAGTGILDDQPGGRQAASDENARLAGTSPSSPQTP